MSNRLVTGIEEIDRKLATLASRQANQIARSSINAGLTVIARQIRTEIDSEPISQDLKKALKATVGKRLETKRSKYGASAKAGFGVGKNTRARAARAAKRAAGRAGRKGVGISANDVHWFALGTKKRFTRRPRRYVGSIQQVPAVRKAAEHLNGLKAVVEAKARERIEALVKR